MLMARHFFLTIKKILWLSPDIPPSLIFQVGGKLWQKGADEPRPGSDRVHLRSCIRHRGKTVSSSSLWSAAGASDSCMTMRARACPPNRTINQSINQSITWQQRAKERNYVFYEMWSHRQEDTTVTITGLHVAELYKAGFDKIHCLYGILTHDLHTLSLLLYHGQHLCSVSPF